MFNKTALATLLATALSFSAAQVLIESGASIDPVPTSDSAAVNTSFNFSDPAFLASLSAAVAARSSLVNTQFAAVNGVTPGIGDALMITGELEESTSDAASSNDGSVAESRSDVGLGSDVESDDGLDSVAKSSAAKSSTAKSSAPSTKPNGAANRKSASAAAAVVVVIVASAFF